MTFWEETKLGSEKRSVIVRNTGDERDMLNTKKHRELWGVVEMFPTVVSDSPMMVCK